MGRIWDTGLALSAAGWRFGGLNGYCSILLYVLFALIGSSLKSLPRLPLRGRSVARGGVAMRLGTVVVYVVSVLLIGVGVRGQVRWGLSPASTDTCCEAVAILVDGRLHVPHL